MVTTLDNGTGQQPAKPHEASAVMEFVLGELRSNPELTYDELRDRAHLNGFEVFPILYGRAKKLLGATEQGEPKATRRTPTPILPGMPSEPAAEPSPKATKPRGRARGPALQFAIAALEKNSQATNGDVKNAAEAAGITAVTPQVMLRARARLGLPGQRKAAREAAGGAPRAEAPTKPARPARPPARARQDANSLDLDALVASIREIEAERDRLRDALERIVAIIEDVTDRPEQSG